LFFPLKLKKYERKNKAKVKSKLMATMDSLNQKKLNALSNLLAW